MHAKLATSAAHPPPIDLVETEGFADYALLDSGRGRKLERFGAIVVDRPEPQALWTPRLAKAEWAKAHAVFSASAEDEEKGRWRVDKPVPESWPIKLSLPTNAPSGRLPAGESEGATRKSPSPGASVTLLLKMQGLWHLGLFPEQVPHWTWMLDRVAAVKDGPPRVLNLFAYTGAATLLAAAAGAEVTHLDASKKAIAWGRENQAASKLDAARIRWILDDAGKFVAREVRRGKTYHVILVDPPKFGRGPEGEVWDLFTNLPAFLTDCAKLLDPKQSSMILTVYAIRASALAFDQLMRDTLKDKGGDFHSGELAIRAHGGNAVPTSLFTRWVSTP
ncbi:MAG: class I SAM-dependent methyltransferase [Hyphomicrobium sp.]|nr:class I SAM-dependent methyltransferase [Hyphomicrobium sp.]